MNKCLIIVDVQNDFLPGGSLAVPNGDRVIEPILQLVKTGGYQEIVLTRDWHPDDHVSFSENPQFVDKSWPPHCVSNTDGAKFHRAIEQELGGYPIFSKGTNPDVEQYSGFAGTNEDGVGLEAYLESQKIWWVDVVGLALDYCVKATALDAAAADLSPVVLLNATAPVSAETGLDAVTELVHGGVILG